MTSDTEVRAPSTDASQTLRALADPGQHDGRPATRWDGRQPLVVAMPDAIGETFSCWLLVEGPVGEARLSVSVATAAATQTASMRVLGQGWRRIHLPFRATQRGAGKPGGPSVTLAWEGQAPAGVTIAIADPALSGRLTGPALSDADLIAQIDWHAPGLEAARTALATGDTAGALRCLVAHLRNKPMSWAMPAVANPTGELAKADAYLKGEISLLSITHRFPAGAIDWLANPTAGTASATNEWLWSINRHNEWLAVSHAYRQTRQDSYAQGWSRLLRSWTDGVPAPSVEDEKAGSAWRDLEAGLRTSGPWMAAFTSMRASPAVSDADIIAFLKSIWDHARLLQSADYNPTNHFIIGMTGLYTCGSMFPEFAMAKDWRTHAAAMFERSLTESVLDEGGWYELAPGYGSWVASKLIDTWNNAEAAGQDGELTASIRAKVRKIAEWGVLLMSPEPRTRDGGPERMVPMLNDGGPLVYNAERAASLAKRFPDSPLLQWLPSALGGGQAAPPVSGSLALPDSGYLVMRTGWTTKDSYAVLDTGPLGGWHGHQDANNIIAYFNGRCFIFDNGGYKYDASDWRRWGPTTAAHNTVLVDGLGQRRSWTSGADPIGRNPAETPAARFSSNDAVDYASGWYTSGYGKDIPNRGKESSRHDPSPAAHRREVLFVKGAHPVMLVLDTLNPSDASEHGYEVRWHLKSTVWKTGAEGRVTWTNDPSDVNLAVVSLAGADRFLADSGVTKPEILGWWFEGQNQAPVPALTLRQSNRSKGAVRILTALVPIAGTTDTMPVAVESLDGGAWKVSSAGRSFVARLLDAGDGPGLRIDGLEIAQPQRVGR